MSALVFSLLLAYLIGAFPTGFLFAKVIKGVDIREHGSGNVGATNVARVVGKTPGLLVLAIDIGKGVLAVTFLASAFYPAHSRIPFDLYRTILGFLAICAHIWNPFLNFRGGKGVATTIGVLAILMPGIFLSSIAVWLITFSTTKYVSLGSLVFGIALPLFAVLFGKPFYTVFFSATICLIITYTHRENIVRLIQRRESKTHLFVKKG